MEFYKSAREYWTPVLTQSMFLDRGLLTPEEFIRAGDQLVRTCPNWQWQSGDTSKRRAYFPANKQYLHTRGVPSYRRVSAMQAATYTDASIDGDREGEEWCAPQLLPLGDDVEDFDTVLIDASDLLTGDDTKEKSEENDHSKYPEISKETATNIHAENIEEYADMEEESLALDESALATTIADDNHSSLAIATKSSNSDCIVIKSRRYDVSITYDNYYRTPRIWLFGYNENGSPLSAHEMFQDVMQDYAKKTVTVDPHPHLSQPHASIHPCQHSAAMLKIIQALSECGKPPSVDQYLFIFLKFIQSVVPTIEYDYTIDVQARGSET